MTDMIGEHYKLPASGAFLLLRVKVEVKRSSIN